MNNYVVQLGLIFLTILFFIVDKSLASVSGVFEYFSLTITFLLYIVNTKSYSTYILEFFFFGILCEWYNRYFLGVGVLISIIILYLFYVFKIMFYSNRLFKTLINLIFAYILAFVYLGFLSVLDIRNLVISFISTAFVTYLWLRE